MIPELVLKETLTPEQWNRYKKEINHPKTVLNIPLDEMIDSDVIEDDELIPSSFLTWSMSWSTTPSGHAYWSALYGYLQSIGR